MLALPPPRPEADAPALAAAPTLPEVASADLTADFLAQLGAATRKAYRRDLLGFAAFLGAPGDPERAARLFLAGTRGQANTVALRWRADLLAAGLAPATVGRRLAAVRSLVAYAARVDAVAWSIDVRSPRVETLRDTRGPGREGVAAIFRVARSGPRTARAVRDLALIHLLYDRALRRAEAAALDLADVDLLGRRIWVLGKGRLDKEPLTIGDPAASAIADWARLRGDRPGALFHRLDPAAPAADPERLDGETVNRIVHRLGLAAGLTRGCNAHGLRHAAITRALDLGVPLTEVAKFSRHKELKTLTKYDDNRSDAGGKVARMLGADHG